MRKVDNKSPNIMTQKLEIGLKNRILYGLMYAEDLPVAVLAEKLDVETKEFSKWCYQGKLPNKEIRKKLSRYFNLPEKILFWEVKN